MADGKYVSYLRVSTAAQGRSGLGLEAQREAVRQHLNGGNWELLHEFVEVESGKREDRPQLQAALKHCKLTGAVLLIAKLDRLSRDAHFLLGLQKAGVRFVAADMPGANDMTVGIMSIVAQEERRMISQRTKAALAAAKARGVKLGCPNGAAHLKGLGNAAAVKALKANAQERADNVLPVIQDIQSGGKRTLREIAKELNERGILTARGGRWHAASVKRTIERLQD